MPPSGERTPMLMYGRVLFAAILAYLLLNLRAAWPFTTDDAFITLRYARNWADGLGLLWNPGEAPVEGYSNFSFVALGAAARAMGLDPILVLKVAGTVSALLSCWLVWRLARLWTDPLTACIAPLFLSLQAGTPWWAVSGLETLFFVAVALGALWLFLGARPDHGSDGSGWKACGAGLLAAVAAASRPEGAIIGISLLLCGLIDTSQSTDGLRRLRSRWLFQFSVFFLGPTLAYQSWRWSFYGRLLANSAYCKLDPGGGSKLLLRYLGSAWPMVLLAVPLLGRRGRDPRRRVLWIVPVLYGVLIWDVVPVLGYHNRHVLPGLALLAVLAAAGAGTLQHFLSSAASRRVTQVFIGILGLGVLLAAAEGTHPGPLNSRARRMADRNDAREAIATFLAERAGPDDLIATPDAGLVPFRLSQPVLDTMCLNCAAATRPPLSEHAGAYAHYVLEREPRFIVAYVGRDGRFRSGLVLGILHRTPAFQQAYELRRFFVTASPQFHFAVYERRETGAERRRETSGPVTQPL